MKIDKKVRVGIMGLNMGSHHLEILEKNSQVKVTALCDIRENCLEYVADQHKISTVYTDYRKMLADKKIDAVVIALPVFLHAPVSIEALNAGKHVLVEKPMAESSAKAREMLDAARRNKLVLTINHNQRFDPETTFLKEYIKKGKLGTVHFARCVWTRPYGMFPRAGWFFLKDKGGGVLLDLGTHLLDKVLSLFDFPDAVQFAASSFTVLGKERERLTGHSFDADDLTVGMIQFANGLTLQLEMGFGSHIQKELLYYELYGDKGGVSTRDGFKLFSAVQGTSFTSVPNRKLPFPKIPTIPDDFIDAILNKRAPAVTPESGIKVTRILEGLRNAAERGWGK
jgi:predicted dehydrogenase